MGGPFSDGPKSVATGFAGRSPSFSGNCFDEAPVGGVPIFEIFKSGMLNGVDQLDSSLTVNSTSVSPTFRYKGGDADTTDWDAWGTGETLTYNGSGDNITASAGSPCFGSSNDNSVNFAGTTDRRYRGSSTSLGNLGTNDFVFEFLVETPSTADDQGIINQRGSGAGAGWYAVWEATSGPRFLLNISEGGGTNLSIRSANTLPTDSWVHIIVFADRDEASTNGSRVYVNGERSGSGVDVSSLGSLDVAQILEMGDRAYTAGAEFQKRIGYVAMWNSASWFAGGAQNLTDWDAVAAERFGKLAGSYPSRAQGTSISTKARNSSAYLDKLNGSVRELYQVGANWIRVVDRNDSASTNIRGGLFEPAATNLVLQSEDFTTTWTELDAGDTQTTSGGGVTPDPTKSNAVGNIADATDGDHGFSQAVTLTATIYTFTVWAKAGDKDWLYISDDTVANATCYFDLSTGSVGTAGAGVRDTFIEDWGNSWYRCGISFTGTAAAHTLKIQTADADSDKTVTGDGATTNTYFWGAQVEAVAHPTSYIPTTTGTVTRVMDTFNFTDSGNIKEGSGTVSCKFLIDNYDLASLVYLYAVSTGANANRIIGYVNTSEGFQALGDASSVTQWNITPAGTVADGVVHKVVQAWNSSTADALTDGVAGTQDTSLTVPSSLDEIDIGHNVSDGSHTGGVISEFKILPLKNNNG